MAKELFVTPVGELMWAKLSEPEENRLDESKARSWSCVFALSATSPDALKLVSEIEGAYQEFHGTGAKASKNAWPFKEEVDDEGVSSGRLLFRFKKNETTRRGMVLPAPSVYDSAKNPWPGDVLIGNGSRGKIAYRAWGWTDNVGRNGVSLNLEAVQILDLVPYARQEAGEAFGVENGYVLATPADAAPAAAQAEGGSILDRLRARAQEVAALPFASDEEVPF